MVATMRTLKTVAVITTLAVVVIGALALVMAGRGWWNAGTGTETTTPTTVTVTAEPETEETTEVTETEEPADTEETEDTEAEATEAEDTDLGLKRDKATVESLSGQERTAVRGVLRDCMDEIGPIHYVSQIKQCLAGDITDWSEDSARRSGEVLY
jgi:flagellar biosynthesis component FlhA